MVGPLDRDGDTAPFLDGTARGEFLLRRCPQGHWSEPAASTCTACGSVELSWAASTGDARLVSWAVTHGRPDGDTPPPRHVLAVVELDEGPWWWTSLVAADPEALSPGIPLRVEFARAAEQYEAVPVFRPV
ncbi:MAG: hypothetical protein JWN57_1813 [Frankiales bacterium]|jgi:uncharacterized OB-fold protein|nr:hypothetical protein [Frankiales bacterium]